MKKKNTSKLEKIVSRNIRTIQVDTRNEDNPKIILAFDNGGNEDYLPTTKAVYDMISEGDGLSHPRLRNGLLNCSKFRFQFVVDNIKGRRDTEPSPTIVAVHLIPDHPYNLCDWTGELGRNVGDDEAIVEINPDNGSICVKAFPNKLVGQLDRFVAAIEKMATIEGSTGFKIGDSKYSVTSIYGNEVSFRVTGQKKIPYAQ